MKMILKSEYFMMGCCLLLFLAFPWLTRNVDAGAAPLDAGMLSLPLLAILSFLIFKSVTWLLLRSLWPAFANYAMRTFDKDFQLLSPGLRICVFLSFYLCLLLGMVVSLQALA